MDRIILLLTILSLSLFSWGREPLSEDEVAAIINEFQFDSSYTELSSQQDGGSWDSCWYYEKTIETQHPKSSEPLRVDLTMYVPNRDDLGTNQVPVVVMLPPTGGINFLDKQMGKTFCSHDTAAIIIKNDFANIVSQAEGSLLPPEDHELTYYRVAAGVKAVMKLSEDDANLNEQKIGIFGVSLGGILASFVMATQENLSAGYFIVAGGDVPNILAYSQQDEVSAIRRKRMKEQGFSDKAEYEQFLRTHITLDPLDLASTMTPETLHMVIAKRDKNVPTENQLWLHEAFGQPDADFTNSGHVDTVLDTLLFASSRESVADFFDTRFALENPRPVLFQWLNQLTSVLTAAI